MIRQLLGAFLMGLVSVAGNWISANHQGVSGAVDQTALYGGTFVIVFLVVWLGQGGWRNFHVLRRRNHVAWFEGVWLQRVDNDRPFSVACIEYDRASGNWVYRGVGYDRFLVPRAEWRTNSVRYDRDSSAWFFTGTGMLLGDDAGVELQRFDIVAILTLPADCRGPKITAKAADFNFARDTSGKDDRIFSIRLVRPKTKLRCVDVSRELENNRLTVLLDEAQAALGNPFPKRPAGVAG